MCQGGKNDFFPKCVDSVQIFFVVVVAGVTMMPNLAPNVFKCHGLEQKLLLVSSWEGVNA